MKIQLLVGARLEPAMADLGFSISTTRSHAGCTKSYHRYYFFFNFREEARRRFADLVVILGECYVSLC